MAERYRFGGPIPESVLRMRKRREWRASSLYATVKRGRAREREAAASTTSRAKEAKAAASPYAHIEARPLTEEQISRLRDSFRVALQGRPGKEQGPWIALRERDLTKANSAARLSKFPALRRALVAMARWLRLEARL